MQDKKISSTKAGVVLAWASVALLIGGAWAEVWLYDRWRLGGLLAATGCAMSAIAATLHIRLFSLRLCSLVRVCSRLEEPDSGRLQAIR